MTEALVREEPVQAQAVEGRPIAYRSSLWPVALSVLSLAVVLLLPVVGLFQASGQGQLMEDGFMLLLPQRVLHGAVAYRNFDWLWGPAGIWVPALFHSVLGWSLSASRLIGFGYAAVLTYATYALVRRWSELLGVFAGAMVALIDRASDLPEYAAIGLAVLSLSLAYRSLSARPERSARWAYLAGLCAGAALLFRPDRGAGAALALAAAFWGHRQRILYAALGIGLAAAAFAGYAGVAGFAHTWENVAVSAALVPGERYLSLPLDGYLMDLWLALVCLAMVLVPLAGWRRRRLSPGSARGPVLLGAGVLAVSLLPEFIQRADPGHLLVAGSLAVALLPVALAELASPYLGHRLHWRLALRYGGAVLAVFGLGAFQEAIAPYGQSVAVTLGIRGPGTSTVSNQGRSFVYASADAPLIAQMVSWIDSHTHPGARLFIGPGDLSRTSYSDNSIAVLLPQLRDEMHFPDMNPAVARLYGAELSAEVNSADIVVLDRQIDQWGEPNVSTAPGSAAANSVIERKFCPAAQFGLYEVLLRCGS